MPISFYLIVLLFLSIFFNAIGQDNTADNWKNCTSVEDVYHLYPDRIHNLFHKLNLDHPGLEGVKAAVKSDNYLLACKHLIDYYKEKAADHFHNVEGGDYDQKITDQALQDTFTITAYTAKVPRTKDGGLNWYKIPEGYYNNQWHQLTRHGWWYDLLHAYLETGELKYVRYLDEVIRDWCIHDQKYNVFNKKGPSNFEIRDKRPGSDMLDAGLRIRRWPRVFYSMLDSEAFRDASILLMLNNIAKHGDYLEDTWKTGNHLIYEMTGIMNIGISFPEFKDADNWVSQAENTLIAEWDKQMLPDGAQYELTHGYHQGVMSLYFQFKELFQKSGREFPGELDRKMEKGINYSAYVMNPRQLALMNNDAPERSLKNKILDKAAMYDRPDWKYIATNGKEGQKPEGLPSVVFPWAGHFISRSGWEQDAHWSFFDVGPWGKGHQHNDKLHLSVYANGRRLLVDNGKYTYKWNKWRRYYSGSKSHNVILVDNNGQKEYQELYDRPFTNYEIKENVDFCMGTFSEGWKNGHDGEHTRALVYLKDKYWVVFDRIDAGKEDIQALWHFHPDCNVVAKGQEVKSDDRGKSNLLIRPVANYKWDVELKRGETGPIQGWYSKDRGYKTPAFCAEYSTRLDGPQTFAWLLFPQEGSIESTDVSTEIIEQTRDYMRVQVQEKGRDPVEITVNLSGTQKPIDIGDDGQLEGKYSVIWK